MLAHRLFGAVLLGIGTWVAVGLVSAEVLSKGMTLLVLALWCGGALLVLRPQWTK
jgi:hypothetical protein